MTTEDIKNKIAALSGLSVEALEDQQRLLDLLVDSFAIVDLSIALQDELNIIFTQEDVAELDTVGDLVALVQGKTA